MQFRDQLAFIYQHLKKSKLRIAMTILATTMGCAFLITLASVAFGLQETLTNDIFSNENITEISLWEGNEFSEEDIEKISAKEHVNAIVERINVPYELVATFEERESNPYSYALGMEQQQKLPTILQQGRLPENENEIIVGADFARRLLTEEDRKIIEEKMAEAEANNSWYDGEDEGYKGSLLDKEVTIEILNDSGEGIEKRIVRVVGIKKDPVYEYEVDNLIIFHTDFLLGKDEFELHKEQTIYVDSVEHVLTVLDELKEEGYQVYSQMEQMKEINLVFLIAKIALIFIGTIAVLIASIGIFNTMTMAVTERTREIGILKAIGASPKLIQRLFLMESLIIGVIGTVIAIIISYVISIAGNILFPIIVERLLLDGDTADFTLVFSKIPFSLLVVTTFISLGVAVLSGWRPARKATKIEVVQALQQI